MNPEEIEYLQPKMLAVAEAVRLVHNLSNEILAYQKNHRIPDNEMSRMMNRIAPDLSKIIGY